MFRSAGQGLHVFTTKFGAVAFAWTPRGISRLELGQPTREAALAAIQAHESTLSVVRPVPPAVRDTARRVKDHLNGTPLKLTDIPVDLQHCTPFSRTVLRKLRQVKPGQTVTYGELARRCGRPGAARAIGRIMGANPVPIIVPCHRCLGANGSLTGFSATGGITLKARLLHSEGYVRNAAHQAGIDHLLRVEKRFRPLIKRVGPYLAITDKPEPGYDTLVRAITHQQLSVKAGQTIAGRVAALTPGPRFPNPAEMRAFKAAELRKCGLSRAKVIYLQDLATKIDDDIINLNRLRHRTDDEIIAALTAVKGVGVWTVHMYLIFHLGRLDVLPVGDLGVCTAAARLFKLDHKPTPTELAALATKWRPYRSLAAWYLWELIDNAPA